MPANDWLNVVYPVVCVTSICDDPETTPLFAFIVPANEVAVTLPITSKLPVTLTLPVNSCVLELLLPNLVEPLVYSVDAVIVVTTIFVTFNVPFIVWLPWKVLEPVVAYEPVLEFKDAVERFNAFKLTFVDAVNVFVPATLAVKLFSDEVVRFNAVKLLFTDWVNWLMFVTLAVKLSSEFNLTFCPLSTVAADELKALADWNAPHALCEDIRILTLCDSSVPANDWLKVVYPVVDVNVTCEEPLITPFVESNEPVINPETLKLPVTTSDPVIIACQ